MIAAVKLMNISFSRIFCSSRHPAPFPSFFNIAGILRLTLLVHFKHRIYLI